jgi:hypothetical protein
VANQRGFGRCLAGGGALEALLVDPDLAAGRVAFAAAHDRHHE